MPTSGGVAVRSLMCSGIVGSGLGVSAVGMPLLAAGAGVSALTITSTVGGALGLIAFQGLIVCINIFRIRNSEHYLAWKRQRVEIMTEQAVGDFF